jgi:hypothetical protein
MIRPDLLVSTITIINQNTKEEMTFPKVRVRKNTTYSGTSYGQDVSSSYQVWACAVNTPNFKELLNWFIVGANIQFVDEYGILRSTRVNSVETPIKKTIHHLKGVTI